jgi:hypothetical protein
LANLPILRNSSVSGAAKADIQLGSVASQGDSYIASPIGIINKIAERDREPFRNILQLKAKISEEKAAGLQISYTIEKLARFEKQISTDGIDGLENKLTHADRAGEIRYALEAKEDFVKLMAEWRFYESAQQMIVAALAIIEYEYNFNVIPKSNLSTIQQMNDIIKNEIIFPLLNDMSGDAVTVDINHVAGMIYWLADQCYVRWHQ